LVLEDFYISNGPQCVQPFITDNDRMVKHARGLKDMDDTLISWRDTTPCIWKS